MLDSFQAALAVLEQTGKVPEPERYSKENTWLSESFRPNLKVHSYTILPHSDLTTGGTLFSLRLQSVGVWFEPNAVV